MHRPTGPTEFPPLPLSVAPLGSDSRTNLLLTLMLASDRLALKATLFEFVTRVEETATFPILNSIRLSAGGI